MTSSPDRSLRALLVSLTGFLALGGCALPSRLGLANLEVDPLEKLTRHEEPPGPSPYPTSLNNPNRPKVVRSVGPEVQPTVTAPPPLPLQQAGTPRPMPLDPAQLPGRLPFKVDAVNENPLPPSNTPSASAPTQKPVATPVVLTPASVDIPSLFAAKESSWPALELKPVVPQAGVPASAGEAERPVPLQPKANNETPAPELVKEPPKEATKDPEPTESGEVLLQKLIASIEKEIRERAKRHEEQELPALEQKLRLLQLVADHSDDAVEKIDRLPPAEREAFKQLTFALSTWLSADEAKRTGLRNAKILRSLHEVEQHLSPISKLDLKNLTFCEKVESFGWFTEFPRAEFAPKQQVILYVEVQNFAAEAKTTTSFETELQGSYQIFDSGGNIVDERQLPLDKEICRNYRRDYFLAYRIYLPSELAPGRYRLELAIADLKAKKEFKGTKQGEAMIEFGIK